MKNIPLLRLDYSDEDIDYIQKGILDVIKSGYLTMGKKVEEFEAEFAKYIGTKYAVAVNSGTSSLEIMLRSFGVKGKTVIVPTVTFMATPISVIHAGGKVAFVDVTKEDLSIDPEDLKRKIAPDTAGVIIVHIGGIISSHYQEIEKICKDMGLFLIEDAAHAHGSSLNGVKAGDLSIGGSFSFYPTKILTTAEGGMITTNDENIYKMALTLREHGKPDHNVNVHTEFGYNWRFSEIHALLGLQQMRKVDYIIAERRTLGKLYDNMRCMGNFRDNRSGGGRNFGRRSFGGDRGGDREMHSAVCSNCGKNCEVPFEPTGSKPVYCFDCFKKLSLEGKEVKNLHVDIPKERLGELEELAEELRDRDAG